MRIGSLFSGIGDLELGLEWAGIGETVWQVEIDEGCRQVLATHWPDAERFGDVRTVGAANLRPVDLICGGFPCQDVSSAGKRTGLSGARSGLWFEYLRIVRELHPAWVVVENVAGGARAWVDTVLAGLGELGYACLPIALSAADVGAPHLRRRIFVVANLDREGQPTESINAEVASASKAAAAYSHAFGRDGRTGTLGRGLAESTHSDWQRPQPDMVRVVHGLSGELDPRNASPRIKALGNAVVPQCAEVVGWVIRELSA